MRSFFFPEESPSLLWNLCVLMDLLKIHFDLIKVYKNRTALFFFISSVNLNNCMQGQFGGPRSNWWIKNQHSLKTGSSWQISITNVNKCHIFERNFYNSVIKIFHGALKLLHLYRFLGPKETNEWETRANCLSAQTQITWHELYAVKISYNFMCVWNC